MKLKPQITSLLVAVFALAALGNVIPKTTAQQVTAVVPKEQPASLNTVATTPPPKSARTAPLSSPTPTPTPANVTRIAQPQRAARGFFRVTLNGFRVNRESDDDILEGDGRGDEIYITTNIWIVQSDGTSQAFRRSSTKVMGDPKGHPERVRAGSGILNSDSEDGGLRTGNTFPWRDPVRRTREPLTDRPPVVLWNGYLTQAADEVVILPIIWEWDSEAYSLSQASVDRQLAEWFEWQRPPLVAGITSGSSASIVRQGSDLLDPHGYCCNSLVYSRFTLDGKAGTRPIGYDDSHVVNQGTPHEFTLPDTLDPKFLVLTYDSAIRAAQAVNFGARGIVEIRYIDRNDHGDYSLFVQVERLDAH